MEGFNHWRVLVLLFSYVASGLTTALMVKKLGAVAKSLCVPVYLGGCYFYAVCTGSASPLGSTAAKRSPHSILFCLDALLRLFGLAYFNAFG